MSNSLLSFTIMGVVSEALLNTHNWETFLQGATPDELGTFHDTLPNNDLGNYRKVCADVFLNNFENALTMLEEGGTLFTKRSFLSSTN